jgi:hypothetical protein
MVVDDTLGPPRGAACRGAFQAAIVVEVLAWGPRFEVVHRRTVPAARARERVRDPDDVATRISQRALVEARLG